MEFSGKEAALRSMSRKFSELSRAPKQPSIYKVHEHLRNVNDKAYEPYIMAIGPYHAGKDNLKMMEEHKLRYLELLLRDKDHKVETYISAVAGIEQQARNCYAEAISLDAAKFIEMLVLDGCFIIELMRKYRTKDSCNNDPTKDSCNNDPIFQWEWVINILQRDLMLFENQIPFFVLCELFDLIEGPKPQEKLIDLVISFFSGLCPASASESMTNRSPDEVKHLLDLIHRNWCPLSDNYYINMGEKVSVVRESRIIRSARELTKANVEFKRRESGTLFDVDFRKGDMLMRPLIIEYRTECLFRNLIAYEQYFPGNRPTFFIDYVRLMDCLINSSKDVEILSKCGIVVNWLGDDEVVANMFNRLVDPVTPEEHFIYTTTFRHVNAFCNRPWSRLSAEYFNSPWAYPTTITALVALLLTVTQTVCAILKLVV